MEKYTVTEQIFENVPNRKAAPSENRVLLTVIFFFCLSRQVPWAGLF